MQKKVGEGEGEEKMKGKREREPPLFPIPLNSLFPFLLYSTSYNASLFLAFRWWGRCKEKWAGNDSKDSFLLLFSKHSPPCTNLDYLNVCDRLVFQHLPCRLLNNTILTFYVDILRGSSHIPAPLTVRGAGTCDKPLRMSEWEATILHAYSTIKKHF